MALSFIKSSGNIITEDFCMSLVNETKADYVKDKSFGADIKKVDDLIASTFEKLRERWEENRTQIIGNELDNANLRKKWILPFLEALNYDPTFISSNIKSESGIEYQIPYRGWDSEYAPLVHMVNSSQDFDTKDKSSRTHSNKSPQDCLQQFLNTSHHQWSILINGKKVRLLRDFFHSITKGFLEFDLESIFETANTEQFRVLYRILHRSRIENQYQGKQEVEYDEEGNKIEIEDNCLLESFHKKSRETGVKVGNKLRDQVIDSIEKLGNGFAENLNPDEFQNGKVKEFYAEILNIIYRLLFLMFAEQKGWLPVRNIVYSRTYSLNALREMAEKGNYSHDEEHDLWEGLKITFKLVAKGYEFKNGDKINAFGGQLFSDKKITIIKNLSLKNKYLLDAIYYLSYFKLDNLSNRINYANLAIDELGSVYESLLDYEPKLAKESATLYKREIKRGEFYLDDRGTDRKTTGSYYTDSRLVAQLIESALVPVINNAISGKNTIEEKEQALLDLKVADIACGSGAFICAALEKMGEQLALIRMGDEERPTEDQLREAKRDVLLHCIYGVDLNPMALELAKFSLWITASLPDMPLTFLDHKLKCGNSLIGATPVLINKGIPEEAYKSVGNDNPAICTELKKKVRREQESMNRLKESTTQYGLQFKRNETDELLRLREVLNNRKQEEVADVDLVEEEYLQLEKMERKFKDWLMADVWTSAFFIDKTEIDQTLYPTNVTLENLRENQPINEKLINRVLKTADHYNFFHYHLEFPEVFEKGGFDCLLGNPPWEKITLLEREFFSSFENIVKEKRSNIRKQSIEKLKSTNHEVYDSWITANIEVDKQKHFMTVSGRFALSAVGELNLYPLFVENNSNLINNVGFSGIIIKSGMLQSPTWAAFTQFLIEDKKIISAYDFRNWEGWFPAIGYHERFTLLTITSNSNAMEFGFYLDDTSEIKFSDKVFFVTAEECLKINPLSKNIATFSSKKDKDILVSLYNRMQIIGVIEGWNIRYTRGLDMTNEAKQLRTFEELEVAGFKLERNKFHDNDKIYFPLLEGKLLHQYDHRFATFDGIVKEKRFGIKAATNIPSDNQKLERDFEIVPRYWVSSDYKINDNKSRRLHSTWSLTFRDTTNVISNFRTFVACIAGETAFNYKAPNLVIDEEDSLLRAQKSALLLAIINSVPFDFITRVKFYGANLIKNIIEQLPIIPFEIISKFQEEIINRVLKLSYTSDSIKSFAVDLNYIGEPFVFNSMERHKIKCELDAIISHLYKIEYADLDYMLDSFPILKSKEIHLYGKYRTKETILQLYDEFTWVRDEMEQPQNITM
jgi:hypothetical protein